MSSGEKRISNFDISAIVQSGLEKAPAILLALLVFVVGRWISSKFSRAVEIGMNKSANPNPTLARFIAGLVRTLILVGIVIIILRIIGIDTSPLTAIVLGLGVAIAFILKDALSDIAAGVMLMLFRPYKIGDEVEIGGTKGVVVAIENFATRMKTRDNIEIIISNGKTWSGVIRNHTAMGARRLDKVFGVSYDADLNIAIKAIIDAAASDDRVYADPAPWAKVVKLNDSSVDIELRIWCDYDDHRKIKMDISQTIKAALDAAEIGIPYPHEIKIRQKVKHSKARDRVRKLAALKNT